MNIISGNAINVTVDMPGMVAPGLAMDIEEDSVFVSPKLERIRISADNRFAILEIRDASYTDEVVEKSNRFLAAMVRNRAGHDAEIIAGNTRSDSGPLQGDISGEFIRRDWVDDYGSAQVAYSGPVMRLARLVNDIAGKFYAKHFDTAERYFPRYINTDVLHKYGYFDGHPNQVTFMQMQSESEDMTGAFQLFEGKTIDDEGCCLSWLGRAFRSEANATGIGRLYEFNRREVVFVGTEDFVEGRRRSALSLVVELAKALDLDMEVTVSEGDGKDAGEEQNGIVLPMLGADGSKQTVACGAMNVYGNGFGERFEITAADGQPAYAGSVRLEIERWVLAAFSQHGFDPDRWPQAMRSRIFD